MPYYEPFSVRKSRAERSGELDVYQYDDIPTNLRAQLCQIFDKSIGRYFVPGSYSMHAPAHNNDGWDTIHSTLCRSLGVHSLSSEHRNLKDGVLASLEHDPTERVLDIVEMCCRLLLVYSNEIPHYELKGKGVSEKSPDALDEVNHRFLRAGVGYQFEAGEIIRVDSQHIHAEVVKPALSLLGDPRFAGAEDEFLDAHGHYRAGDYHEAITLANNAFESTMKCVCAIKNWEYSENARASDLLKVLRNNGLWPEYLDASFNQLQATLANGLPQIRNNEGSHGQGPVPKEAPDYVASYALHLAAANILYIVKAATHDE